MGDLPYRIPKKEKDIKTLDNKTLDNKVSDNKVSDNKVSDNKVSDNKVSVESGRIYTQEEVDGIIKKREQVAQSDDDEFGLSPKLLKGLQSTVGVFNALKEFASSPLTRLIETRVGERAAGIVDQAFGPTQHTGDKKDLLDMFLNSQMAFGFGQGLGARGPEFLETLGKTFGKERIDKFADNMLDQYGNSKGSSTNTGIGVGGGIGGGIPNNGVKENSQKDLLLTLDPNNPEHISAYAESQGGIRTDVARKMLMIHQNEFIKQMEEQGLDISGFDNNNRRNSRNNTKVTEETGRNNTKVTEETGRNNTKVTEETEKSEDADEMARLKREQLEMIKAKREAERQLQQLDLNMEKVVSFKDIKNNAEDKKKVVEKVAEIPDGWSNEDLSESERESIAKGDRERHTVVDNPVIDTHIIESISAPELNFEVPENLETTDTAIELKPSSDILDLNKVNKDIVNITESGRDLSRKTAMCLKCRKIKVLYETDKGIMCEACKKKRGL